MAIECPLIIKQNIIATELLNEWWFKQTDDLKKQICELRMTEINEEMARIQKCLEDIRVKEALRVAGAQYNWNS